MNKSELVKDVARRTGLSLKDAEISVQETLGAIKSGLEKDGETKILGFGIFKKVTRAARVGRNPATGLPIEISEKTVCKFKPYF